MTPQEHDVPQYFADFAQENARQHQGLSDRISAVHQELSAAIHEVKGELHIIKIVGIAMLVALLGILGTGVTGLVTYFLNL